MFVLCPFGQGKRKTTIFNISKKRKCMIKMNTENEFAGLKLYAFFIWKTVDEAPKLFADEFRSFNSRGLEKKTSYPNKMAKKTICK
jgi:hypothetical protein